jgi:hypothetical protein
LGAKPLTNPDAKSFASHMIDVVCSLLWIGFITTVLCGFFFGSLMSYNANGLIVDLGEKASQMLLQAMLDY